MSDRLCITVRWLGDRFHGFTDDRGGPEWPPSPFRLLQALVAGAYQHGVYDRLKPALEWIERQPPPEILADFKPATGNKFDHYVPDNDYLLDHKKPGVRTIEPVLLGERPTVTYVWPINPVDKPEESYIDELCSTLSSFGCGVDQAFASARVARVAEVEADSIESHLQFRHSPTVRSSSHRGTLRVPIRGSLDDLNRVFKLNRRNGMIQTERRKKRWPNVFHRVVYTGLASPAIRPHALFRLLDDDDNPVSYPHDRLIHLAGMVRHLAGCVARQTPPPWLDHPQDWLERFVLGHPDPNTDDTLQRVSYLPLPSIGHPHADALVRNIMLVAPVGLERELDHLANYLDGQELQPEDPTRCAWETQCRLPPVGKVRLQRFQPRRDHFIQRCYLAAATEWHTVTPVILDGHNDRSHAKTIKLIQRALARAGIEQPCEFEWQSVPFLKNCLSAHKYDRDRRFIGYHRPQHLKDRTALHLRIRFGQRENPADPNSRWIPASVPLPGPLALGAGRHLGLGILASAQ